MINIGLAMPSLNDPSEIGDSLVFMTYAEAFDFANKELDKIKNYSTLKQWCKNNTIGYNSLMTHIRNADPKLKKSPKLLLKVLEALGKNVYNASLDLEPTYTLEKKPLKQSAA